VPRAGLNVLVTSGGYSGTIVGGQGKGRLN
jgi:hypothetical protein